MNAQRSSNKPRVFARVLTRAVHGNSLLPRCVFVVIEVKSGRSSALRNLRNTLGNRRARLRCDNTKREDSALRV